jgi:hypothetical protein
MFEIASRRCGASSLWINRQLMVYGLWGHTSVRPTEERLDRSAAPWGPDVCDSVTVSVHWRSIIQLCRRAEVGLYAEDTSPD